MQMQRRVEKQQQMEKQRQMCPLVATMWAAEEVNAAEKEEAATAVAKQKAAAIAADNSIRQRVVLELGQRSRKEKEKKETVEEKAELKG
jgi:hypothetical protein